jgi:predicted ATPase
VVAFATMLRRLRVKNFKLLRDVEITFEPDVPTVLIGPNASGKSTVLEVIDFLNRCAVDGLAKAVIAHGGMQEIKTTGADGPVEIETEWCTRVISSVDATGTVDLCWSFAFDGSRRGAVRIEHETLRNREEMLVETTSEGRRVFYERDPSARPGFVHSDVDLAFTAMVDVERFPKLTLLRVLVDLSSVIGALSTAPAWARLNPDGRSSPRDSLILSSESQVGREGSGLATALYNLQNDHDDAWKTLLRAFQAEFPFARRLLFPPDPGGSRIGIAYEDARFGGARVYASQMSDGMISFLCLLALILHPGRHGALGLDEPDAHLHPSALRRLVSLAHSPSGLRTLVIATHSDRLLDFLREPARSIRLVDSTPTGAQIRTIDAASLAAWRETYSLADMRAHGLLDQSNTQYGQDP